MRCVRCGPHRRCCRCSGGGGSAVRQRRCRRLPSLPQFAAACAPYSVAAATASCLVVPAPAPGPCSSRSSCPPSPVCAQVPGSIPPHAAAAVASSRPRLRPTSASPPPCLPPVCADVLGSILGALKSIVAVIGMTRMTPPIKDLLPRLTPILKNRCGQRTAAGVAQGGSAGGQAGRQGGVPLCCRFTPFRVPYPSSPAATRRHEKVQENCIDLVGRIADRGAEFVPAREWMRICFELLDMLNVGGRWCAPVAGCAGVSADHAWEGRLHHARVRSLPWAPTGIAAAVA